LAEIAKTDTASDVRTAALKKLPTTRLIFSISAPSPDLAIRITNDAVREFNSLYPGVMEARQDPGWTTDGYLTEVIVIRSDSISQAMTYNDELKRLFAEHQIANGVLPTR